MLKRSASGVIFVLCYFALYYVFFCEYVKASVYPIFNKRTKVNPAAVKCDDGESERPWKIMAWNVAGLRAFVKKQGHKAIIDESADLIFLSEIKCKELPAEFTSGFKTFEKILVVSEEKNGGYAGVALLSKVKPIEVWKGIGNPQFDGEGRLVVAEYPRFYFIGSYVPNSGRGLVNMDKRKLWEALFLTKIKEFDEKKPIIYGGDLNVAHNEIDLALPASNRNKTAGFTDQERQWFSTLLNAGFKDTYRTLNGKKQEFTFWSYMGNARAKNIGWRLDYFIVSNRIMEKVITSEIRTDIMGSDHAPIILDIVI